MKKIMSCVLIPFMLTGLVACGDGVQTTRVEATNQVEKVLEDQVAAAEPTETPEATLQNESLSNIGTVTNTTQVIPYLTLDDIKEVSGDSDVDIDITAMNSDMVYATVFNILNDPASYEGCTVRMNGQIVYSYNDDMSKAYANVIIADALACCAQGLEFQWGLDGEYNCPEDYPPEGSEVLVKGTLETYIEDGLYYFRIGNSEMSVVTG